MTVASNAVYSSKCMGNYIWQPGSSCTLLGELRRFEDTVVIFKRWLATRREW